MNLSSLDSDWPLAKKKGEKRKKERKKKKQKEKKQKEFKIHFFLKKKERSGG